MKRFILSFLFLALVFAGFGQKHIRLSFTGSPTVNWMTTNNSSAGREKSILGYDFGLNADFYFAEDERYSLLTGLLITNTGGEIAYRGNSDFQFAGVTLPAMSRIKYLLRYIELPITIKLKTDQFRRSSYWGQLGFSGMVNIGSKGDSNDGTFKKANINDEMGLFNLAMNVGIGFDFDLGTSNSVSTGLIFQNGLIDITTNNAFTDKTIINSLKLRIALIF
ncbi:MAG: outer membrane beta-barrel protein [Bacteroidota bacterium]|nr:outer membrane beta-barrel protein [Bacteroidota bacterium]